MRGASEQRQGNRHRASQPSRLPHSRGELEGTGLTDSETKNHVVPR